MALARARRGNRHIDYWPGFVDALSTLLMAIMFLLSVFVLAQFLLSREISGRDEVLARLNSQINELTQLLALEQGSTQDAAGQRRQSAGLALRRRKRALAPAAASRPGRRRGFRSQCAARRRHRRTGRPAADQPAGALPGRAAQPADRRAAQADRRARGGARRVGSARPRVQHQDRRSRPPAERRAGAARAGAQPLPLRFLRPPARDPVRPREHPHRRRPLRLPVGSAVPVRLGRDQRGRPASR